MAPVSRQRPPGPSIPDLRTNPEHKTDDPEELDGENDGEEHSRAHAVAPDTEDARPAETGGSSTGRAVGVDG